MYKDTFESIRNEAEKRNLRERTIQLYCSDVSYFLRWIGKMFLILHLKMRKVFLLLNVWKVMTLRRMIWLNPQSHLWFVDKSTLSVIIFAKIIYFVIILLSQAVVKTLSRQPFFYTIRYSFPLFYIFPGNRKTRRTEVLRVSYVWTQRYLTITNLYSDCITRWL